MVLYTAFYALAALIREVLCIVYYAAIVSERGLLVSGVGFLISLMDLFVIGGIAALMVSDGIGAGIFPMIAYAIFGAVGSYFGMKIKPKI